MTEMFINYLSISPTEKVPNYMVVLLGVGTVFLGLVCIVFLIKIVGLFFKKSNTTTSAPVTPVPAVIETTPIENRQEIIAAVSAAIAEELGTDISAIRIHSFKKI